MLVLLYSVIESGIYSSALKALERFCSLCDRALPALRKDALSELKPELEQMAQKQDLILEYLERMDAVRPVREKIEEEWGDTARPEPEEEEAGRQ